MHGAKIKRNDVVYSKHDAKAGHVLYGRVNRIMPDGMIETIDCGRYIRIQHSSDLVIDNDYRGYYYTVYISQRDEDGELKTYQVWRSMTGLRRLKQMAARYDKTVWKKYRKGLYCEATRYMDLFEDKQRMKNGL